MAMSVVYTNFDGQIVHENRGGVERSYVPDTLGSTIALVDENQQITDTFEYWAYGEIANRTGTHPTPFTFVGTLGYYNDILNKLFYVRARYYRPDLARWQTADRLWPKELAFTYVQCMPIHAVDPSGDLLTIVTVGIILIGIAPICAMAGANAGCRTLTPSDRAKFLPCLVMMQTGGYQDLAKFGPTLICDDIAEKTDAMADAKRLIGGHCQVRVDLEDWQKLDPAIGCQTLIHEALHCLCGDFPTKDHDWYREWSETIYEDARLGRRPRDLREVCRKIKVGIGPR